MAEARRRRLGPGGTFVVVLMAFAVLIALGTWQMERRAWKAELIATMEQRLALAPLAVETVLASREAVDFRPLRASGSFRHDREFYLAARSYQGKLGYHVVTPLVLNDGRTTVMVDRGWVPVDRRDPASRPLGQIAGAVSVTGIARLPPRPGVFTPDNRPEQNQWYWIDITAMAQLAGAAQVAPFVIDAAADNSPGGLPIGGQTRITLSNDHLQYAITWYALAVVLAVIYLVSLRRRDGGDTAAS